MDNIENYGKIHTYLWFNYGLTMDILLFIISPINYLLISPILPMNSPMNFQVFPPSHGAFGLMMKDAKLEGLDRSMDRWRQIDRLD